MISKFAQKDPVGKDQFPTGSDLYFKRRLTFRLVLSYLSLSNHLHM